MVNSDKNISITVNGVKYEAPKGIKVLNFCRYIGIDIPTLCHLKDYSDVGSCRMCMVEIEGYDSLVASCRTKVEDGMVITT
ncbi:MAG: (2Fe-2S)-binding protein, partial [Lachnospiraceae bacterium]|nr:(2Fe-2S)-binding protein [Lachnospiraceae bacterium]